MKYNVRIALLIAAANEVERIKKYIGLWEENTKFWEGELADIEEALEYLKIIPVEDDDKPV
jgi:hypothetical protein